MSSARSYAEQEPSGQPKMQSTPQFHRIPLEPTPKAVRIICPCLFKRVIHDIPANLIEKVVIAVALVLKFVFKPCVCTFRYLLIYWAIDDIAFIVRVPRIGKFLLR